ncbi:hypothetical protein ABZZ79_06555 [Streptomyces sp. NPDC006458]
MAGLGQACNRFGLTCLVAVEQAAEILDEPAVAVSQLRPPVAPP